jgi:acyl dehydratase
LANVKRMTTVFDSPDALLTAVGQDLGHSEWVAIDQQRIDGFADSTGDHQWIHVDPVRAADGPFGATIAHGYLTLALTNYFLPEIVQVDNVSMGVNYGVNKARFPQPVTVGSRVRGSAVLTSAEEISGGVQAVITITVEIEGAQKPACVVESVSRFLR